MSENPKKRHCFDDAFKQETVRRLLESGKPVYSFAREAGVERSVLHRWVKKYRTEDHPSATFLVDGESFPVTEIRSLKKEVAELKVMVRVLQRIVEKSFADRYGFEYSGSVVAAEDTA